jgi:hypothetical protein
MANNNGGILLSRQKPTTYSATNYQTGYEIANAFDPNPSLVFKSSQNSVTINFAYNAPVSLEAIALIFHTIPENATVKFRKCTAGYIKQVEYDVPIQEKDTYCRFNESTSYQYYQLYISASAPVQIGCIFPALTAFQFPHQYSWSFKKKFEVKKEVETTDEGFHIETPGEDETPPLEYLEFTITFNDADSSFYKDYCNLIRVGNKVFIPLFSENVCYYGIVSNNELDGEIDMSGDTYNITFLEHATGES